MNAHPVSQWVVAGAGGSRRGKERGEGKKSRLHAVLGKKREKKPTTAPQCADEDLGRQTDSSNLVKRADDWCGSEARTLKNIAPN